MKFIYLFIFIALSTQLSFAQGWNGSLEIKEYNENVKIKVSSVAASIHGLLISCAFLLRSVGLHLGWFSLGPLRCRSVCDCTLEIFGRLHIVLRHAL